MFRTRASDTLPKIITHERIYIVPSRRGWMFVLSLLVMLIAAINYNLSLGYALCFLLTGMFASALISTYRNFSGIEVVRINKPETTLGEKLQFTLTLANTGPAAHLGIDIANANSNARVDVPAHQRANVSVALPTKARGWQPAGRFTLSSDYPLGLWFTWSYLHVDCHGLVYPKPEHSPPALPFDHEISAHSLAKSSTQGDFESLREYQAGDSPGSIAWKTLARGLGLHTRQFASESSGAELTLDWEATRMLNDVEQRLSRLAAWATLAHQQGIAYKLTIPGFSGRKGSGDAHLTQTLQQLAMYGLPDADTRL